MPDQECQTRRGTCRSRRLRSRSLQNQTGATAKLQQQMEGIQTDLNATLHQQFEAQNTRLEALLEKRAKMS